MNRSFYQVPDRNRMRNLIVLLSERLGRQQTHVKEHPEADLLLALSKGGVSRREHQAVVSHLAVCAICRDVLALASTDGTEAPAPRKDTKPWGWRLAATLALGCLVITAVWLPLRQKPLGTAPAVSPRSTFTGTATSQAVGPASSLALAPHPRKDVSLQPKASLRANSKKVIKPGVSVGPSSPAAPQAAASARQSVVPPDLPPPTNSIAMDQSAALPATPPPAQPLLRASAETRFPPNAPSSVAPHPVFSFTGKPVELRLLPKIGKAVWEVPSIAGAGTVNKSEDGGRTWRTVPVDSRTPLYSVSALGPQVWVGGADGKLFRSDDDGVNWSVVPVTEGDVHLIEPILSIKAQSPVVTLTTKPGTTWISRDNGEHWRRR